MTDAEALALNGFQEANIDPDDGLAAVVRVTLNRTRLRYESDGSIQSTVFWPNAFSWTQWEMEKGHYTKVAWTEAETQARAAKLLAEAKDAAGAWARACRIAEAVHAGTYRGPDYDKLTDATVLYLNPAISRAFWATSRNFVCRIGRQDFYRAA